MTPVQEESVLRRKQFNSFGVKGCNRSSSPFFAWRPEEDFSLRQKTLLLDDCLPFQLYFFKSCYISARIGPSGRTIWGYWTLIAWDANSSLIRSRRRRNFYMQQREMSFLTLFGNRHFHAPRSKTSWIPFGKFHMAGTIMYSNFDQCSKSGLP